MACGLTVIKKFTYRGQPEEWSNTYWFTGSTPADAAAWSTLADAVILQEKALYTSSTTVVRAYGYSSDAADREAVWSKDFTVSPASPVAGTFSSANTRFPGDTAAWVRWKLTRTGGGRAIYLRKYFHDVVGNEGSPTVDSIATAQVTAYNAFGLKMRDGTFLDARTLTARGHTDTITSHGASTYATTRTLKRRPKRNPT